MRWPSLPSHPEQRWSIHSTGRPSSSPNRRRPRSPSSRSVSGRVVQVGGMRSPTFTPKQTSSLRSARVGWLSSLTGRDGHSVPARRSLSRAVAHFFVNAHEGDTEVALRFTPAQNHLRLFLAFAMATQTNPEWFGPKGEPKLLGMALALHTFKD